MQFLISSILFYNKNRIKYALKIGSCTERNFLIKGKNRNNNQIQISKGFPIITNFKSIACV